MVQVTEGYVPGDFPIENDMAWVAPAEDPEWTYYSSQVSNTQCSAFPGLEAWQAAGSGGDNVPIQARPTTGTTGN